MASNIRLSKAAKELNVGISTLVEFLSSKGIDVVSNPNTKLEDEHYEILRNAFAADQSLKEEAEKKDIKREKRQTISIKTEEEESESDIPESTETDTPTPVETNEIKVEEEIIEEDVKKTGPKVIAKINLDELNPKTRPAKQEETPTPETPKEEPKQEPETPKEEPVHVKEEEPKKEEDNFIRVKTQKLTGPKVLGSIQLPIEAEKKPKEHDSDNKRKRKRIKKVDVKEQPVKKEFEKKGGNPHAKKKFEPKQEISEKDIEKEIKETLARLSNQGTKSKGSKLRREKRQFIAEKREKELEQEKLEESILKITEFVTVSELAAMMNVQATEVISACMSLGIFASINQRLDAETIQIVADEFGFEVEFVSADVHDAIPVEEDKPEDLVSRPPIITVMGHVDHGKTSLLDRIRKANIADGEAGGITQHIGAYSVKIKDRILTFLDTPGHEAFTAMRARGAQVTDVAIIIVAADDQVMPQTKEAIAHAQAANVPMVFAINKIDKPGANSDKIREQLSGMNILVEDWGGKYQVQEISAKQGLHIEELLEKVILEADLLDLKANPKKNAIGTVLESSLDKGKGYITNMLVESGTLHIGDIILAGKYTGRVRAMLNEKGQQLKEAPPSTPISVLGINGAPSAGDKFYVMEDEREARSIATKRDQLSREQGLRTQRHITLDEIGRRLAIGDFKELNLIIKGDVDGSIEALSDSLLKLSNDEIAVNIVHKGVGAITEADVNLASASDAIIVGFQVRPTTNAKKLAEEEQIDIRLYSIIYKAIEELKDAIEGMLSPDIKEEIVGTAEVRETFNITKVGTIAGCFVTSGYIKRTSLIRIIRDGIVIHEGTLGSLKRFKDDVKEVKNNYECGLNIEKFNDIKEGDIIEAYEEKEVARKL
ncbi:MAG: translation initiation factor IF-2 [Brumimicrobium sp.]|nr:translation initiation factor IF-2 [Brumimicrobium sp.]